MASMDIYCVWNVVVPAVLSALLWLVICVVMLVLVPFLHKMPRIFVEILQLSLSDVDCENRSCSRVAIDGQKIKRKALKVLVLLVIPLTAATIFFSFWNVWLVWPGHSIFSGAFCICLRMGFITQKQLNCVYHFLNIFISTCLGFIPN